MPIHRIQAPDGKIIKVEAPDGASQEEIVSFAAQSYVQQQQQSAQPRVDNRGIGERVLSAAQNVPNRIAQQASDFGTGALTSFYGLGQGAANLAGGVSSRLDLPRNETVSANVDRINAFLKKRRLANQAEYDARPQKGLFNVDETLGEVAGAAAMYPYRIGSAATTALPKVASPLIQRAKQLGNVVKEGVIGTTLFTPATGEGDYATEKAIQAAVAVPTSLAFVGGGALAGKAAQGVRGLLNKSTTQAGDLPSVNFDQLKFTDIQSMAGTNKDADIRAVNKVVDALKKQFPNNYQAVINEWQSTGKPLIEVFQPKVTSLAETSALYPQGTEQAQKYFQGQAAGSAERVQNAIKQNVSPIGNVVDTVAERVKLGQEAAAPLYKEAFRTSGNQPVSSPRLQTLLEDPAYKAALKEGLVMEERNARIIGEKFNPYDYGVTGYEVNGDPILSKVPNLKLLDLMKRSLNSQLKSGNYKDPVTGRLTDTGRQLTSLNSNLVNEIDNILGSKHPYTQARKVAGDYLSAENATLKGKDFFTTNVEELQRDFKKLTPAEQLAYKDGVVSAARDRIGRISSEGGNPYTVLMGKTNDNARWQKILSPKEFNDFYQSLKGEDLLFKTRNQVLGNSATARRQNQIKDFELSRGDVLASAGSIKTLGLSQLAKWLKQKASGLTDDMAGSVSQILYENNPRQKALIMKKVFGDEKLSASEKKMIKDVYLRAENPIEELKSRLRAGATASSVNTMRE